jgi:NAD(P)H dehydrogenase (quinone)
LKITVILGHPRVGSFNHAIATTAARALEDNLHEVMFHDLYEERFDPVLPGEEIPRDARLDAGLRRYCEELAASEGIVVVHPNWWGQPPAILKGWIDRVCRPDIAYEFVEGDSGEGIPVGLLRARTAIVFNTSNTPQEREFDVFGDPLERLWKNCVFELCGVRDFHRRTFSTVVTSTPGQRREWLGEVRETVNRYFPK